MAHSPSKDTIAESIWLNTKTKCPICGHPITKWYCPDCGLSKNNSGYIIYENELFHCGPTHFNQGIHIDEYKLCDKCRTPNPTNANYCRCCGENIATRAMDQHGHGWVDLGLSVLWSTESLSRSFTWNDSTIIDDNDSDKLRKARELYTKSNCGESGGRDAASYWWGTNWRTPTLKELEELITKCKWVKYIDPITDNFALKVTGPNGNSIMFPLNSSGSLHTFSLWSSTAEDNKSAYCLVFREEVEFPRTLTSKQKKRWEFEKLNETRFRVDLSTDELWLSLYSKDPLLSIHIREDKRRKTFPQYEVTLEQQRKILDAMGDDSQEIEKNRKEDLTRYHNSWLTTPIKISRSGSKDIDSNGTMRIIPSRKYYKRGIRPVADKK